MDRGCGRGDYWQLFEQVGVSGIYIGIDVRTQAHWSAIQGRENASGIICCFLQAKGEHLCLVPNVLDFAYSSCSLEHIEDDRKAIVRLFDAAKPGSHVLLIVPSSWAHFLYVYHGYRKYSTERLITLCCSAGFEVVQVYALGGLFIFLLHSIWITWLESGQLFEAVFGARLPARILNLLQKVSYTSMRTQPALRTLYVALLKTCLKLDSVLPLLPAGYAVVAKRP